MSESTPGGVRRAASARGLLGIAEQVARPCGDRGDGKQAQAVGGVALGVGTGDQRYVAALTRLGFDEHPVDGALERLLREPALYARAARAWLLPCPCSMASQRRAR
jgi:hypothetical protein